MQLAIISAIVMTLCAAEAPPIGSWQTGLFISVGTIVFMSIPWLTALHITRAATVELHFRFPQTFAVTRQFLAWQRIHLMIWLACTWIVLFALNWPSHLKTLWGTQQFLWDELVICLIVFVPLIVSWWTYYDLERELWSTGSETDLHLPTRAEFVTQQIRHQLLIPILPVLWLVAVKDTIHLLFPDQLHHAGVWYAVALIPALLLTPWLLPRIWKTEPLAAGPLRCDLEGACKRWGVRLQQIFLWRTQGECVNAVVTGIIPTMRYLLLSDGLVARCSHEQIHCVLAHEAGHIRRHHLMRLFLLVMIPVTLWIAWSFHSDGSRAPMADARIMAGMSVLVTAAIVGGMAWIIARYARLLEHEADLWACHVLAREAKPENGPCAWRTYQETMRVMVPNAKRQREEGWLHPSIESRCRFLDQASTDPRSRLRFERQLAWYHRAILLAHVAPWLMGGPLF